MNDTIKTLVETPIPISFGQMLAALALVALGFAINHGLLRLSTILYTQPILWVRRLRYWIPITRLGVTLAAVSSAVMVLAPPQQFLIAVLASAGVAIGLAAQELVKDVFGSLVIWSDRTYAEGDRIKIGDVEGIVKSIGLRSTKIWAFDDTMIAVPNSKILSEPVYNANSGEPDEQVVVDLYLPPSADTDLAAALARSAAIAAELVEPTKPVTVLVGDHLTSSGTPATRIRIKAYVRNVGFEPTFASEVATTAKRLFRKHGLYNIPGATVASSPSSRA